MTPPPTAPPATPAELEDLDVRSGSAGSMLRTFVGVHLRELDNWIATAHVVSLLSEAGAGMGGARSALNRARTKGLLIPERRDGTAGHRLADAAVPMLERGDRRVFGYRSMRRGEPWAVVAFSVPESQRHMRHRLRSRLTWLGFGVLGPGTWIGPGHLAEETLAVLAEEGLRDFVTLLSTDDPQPPVPLREAVTRWWDLEALQARYLRFLDAHGSAGDAPCDDDRQAFAEHLRLVDDWREIPSLDPGLPPDLTPPGWTGHDGVALFAARHSRLADPARRHVARVVATTAPRAGDPTTNR